MEIDFWGMPKSGRYYAYNLLTKHLAIKIKKGGVPRYYFADWTYLRRGNYRRVLVDQSAVLVYIHTYNIYIYKIRCYWPFVIIYKLFLVKEENKILLTLHVRPECVLIIYILYTNTTFAKNSSTVHSPQAAALNSLTSCTKPTSLAAPHDVQSCTCNI